MFTNRLMRQGTKKERRWKYVNYEKINTVLMEILEIKYNVKIEKKIERIEKHE